MQAREWPSENSNCKLQEKAGDNSAKIRAIYSSPIGDLTADGAVQR